MTIPDDKWDKDMECAIWYQCLWNLIVDDIDEAELDIDELASHTSTLSTEDIGDIVSDVLDDYRASKRA